MVSMLISSPLPLTSLSPLPDLLYYQIARKIRLFHRRTCTCRELENPIFLLKGKEVRLLIQLRLAKSVFIHAKGTSQRTQFAYVINQMLYFSFSMLKIPDLYNVCKKIHFVVCLFVCFVFACFISAFSKHSFTFTSFHTFNCFCFIFRFLAFSLW